MEQLVLILAVLAALAGFGMGLMNIAGPLLKSRNITLPAFDFAALLKRRAATDDEDELDFEDQDDIDAARDFAESSFVPSTLLRPRAAFDPNDEEIDDELAGVLDQVADEDLAYDDTEDAAEDDGSPLYRVAAAGLEDDEDEPAGDEDVSLRDEGASEDEGDEEDLEDDEDVEEEAAEPEVKVAQAAAESDDMLSFFSESEDSVGKVHLAWRDDLPEVSIEDLLAEARAIRQQIKDKSRKSA